MVRVMDKLTNIEKEVNDESIKDYRFILYRLDQLESEEKENFRQLMQTLQLMQEGMNEQNKTLTELRERQNTLEEKTSYIKGLVEITTKHETELQNIYHRLNIYKAVLVGVSISFIGYVLVTIIQS